ncbi:MAG: hypothetical protein RQ723_05260 [Desulfuromonadales bacterium]|nr:hypothetical protein [Desulfuromonadales bacterium]
MLPGEPFVRGQQDDPVQFVLPPMLLQVVLILQNIDMHQQGFAGTGRIPERQFLQFVALKGRDLITRRPALVEDCHMGIQGFKQSIGIGKITIQIDLGQQQRQILKILPRNPGFALAGDGLGVAEDILVISEQKIVIQLLPFKEPLGDPIIKTGDIVLVVPFAGVAHDAVKLINTADFEQRQQPLVQNQPFIKFQGNSFGFSWFFSHFLPHLCVQSNSVKLACVKQ